MITRQFNERELKVLSLAKIDYSPREKTDCVCVCWDLPKNKTHLKDLRNNVLRDAKLYKTETFACRKILSFD